MPIYKNKGDPGNSDSYRGITLVSSVGKVFTSILNSRLTKYAGLVDMIPNAQAGFRKGYSTTDNTFCLHVLIDIYIKVKLKMHNIIKWYVMQNDDISGFFTCDIWCAKGKIYLLSCSRFSLQI